jgi:hypothetical protein
LKRLPKIEKNASIIAIDTECSKEKLLSIQLATLLPDGTIAKGIYLQNTASFTTSTQAIWTLVTQFAADNGIKLKHDVYLLTHWGVAELRHVNDFFEEYSVSSVSRGIHAKVSIDGHTLRFRDTYPLFMSPLNEVGKSIGFEKISLDNFQGKSEKYWKEHMDELQSNHLGEFADYALRDVEVLVKAFDQWRQWFIQNFKLDILKCASTADVAARIFRHYYLKEPLSKARSITCIMNVPNSKGEYVPRTRNQTVFDGDLNVRRMSLLSAWGGRNESFIYGRYAKPVSLLDIKSSYGTMCKMQALPVADTVWKKTTDLGEVLLGEGYVQARFKFPNEFNYPCLPVHVEGFGLIYPLEGETYCTTAEVRLARKYGAEIEVLEAYVFTPSYKEATPHPVKKYVEFLSKMKDDAKQSHDTLSEAIAKMLLNSLVGKMIQRNPEYSERDLMDLRRRVGVEAFKEIYKDKTKREKYKVQGKTGTLWLPECWSLIVGRGRAMLSSLMTAGALHSVTDSCVLPSNAILPVEALAELKSAGSDFEKKTDYDGDEFWSGRTRLFSVLKNGEPFEPRRGGIASDDFSNAVLKPNLAAGKPVVSKASKTHVVTLKEALVDSCRKLGSDYVRGTEIDWKWDMKRKLVDWKVNLWTNFSETRPWKNKEQFLLARMIKQSRLDEEEKTGELQQIPDFVDLSKEARRLYPPSKRGRKERISTEIVERAQTIRQLKPKTSLRRAAQELGISHTQVKRIWEHENNL